jgi:hypothetical protein
MPIFLSTKFLGKSNDDYNNLKEVKISVSWASEVSQRNVNNYMLELHTCNVSMVKLDNCTFKRKKEKERKRGKKRKEQTKRYSTPKVGP